MSWATCYNGYGWHRQPRSACITETLVQRARQVTLQLENPMQFEDFDSVSRRFWHLEIHIFQTQFLYAILTLLFKPAGHNFQVTITFVSYIFLEWLPVDREVWSGRATRHHGQRNKKEPVRGTLWKLWLYLVMLSYEPTISRNNRLLNEWMILYFFGTLLGAFWMG